MFEFLKGKGISLTKTDAEGNTPLHYACAALLSLKFSNAKQEEVQKLEDAIKYLTENGADMNAENNVGSSPASILSLGTVLMKETGSTTETGDAAETGDATDVAENAESVTEKGL